MPVLWRLGLVLFGFAVATFVAAVSHAPMAAAQERPGASSTADTSGDWTEGYETAPRTSVGDGDGDVEGEGEPMPESFYDQGDDLFPSADPGDESGAGEPRPALNDGVIPDGRIDDAVLDGELGRDTRPPEDLAVFETPPAGHDPLLFQVEDVDPIETDRRPRRFARFEPYDPVGIRIGSFVLFPEAELGGVYNDNVLGLPIGPSDKAGEIRTETRLVSNWSAHALELRGTTFSTYHDDYGSEDDRAWSLEARGRLDITRRTNLQGIAAHSVSQEQRTAIDATQVGPRPDVTTDEARLALNHRFNRLSVELRGSVSDTTYSRVDGMDNTDRDTVETRQAVRAGWELKPTLTVFAEGELNQRDKREAPADGIPRDSDGYRTRVGVDFGATGALLRGQVSVGYGHQTPRDSRLAPVDAFLFDANLAWRPSEITSVLLTASSDIYDTTTTGSGGVVSHSVGIEGRHALRRYLIASAGLGYTHYDYHDAPFEESAVTTFAGLEYYASPELVLFARYQHLNFDSNDVDGDYTSDEVRLGVRVRK